MQATASARSLEISFCQKALDSRGKRGQRKKTRRRGLDSPDGVGRQTSIESVARYQTGVITASQSGNRVIADFFAISVPAPYFSLSLHSWTNLSRYKLDNSFRTARKKESAVGGSLWRIFIGRLITRPTQISLSIYSNIRLASDYFFPDSIGHAGSKRDIIQSETTRVNIAE